MAARRLRRRRVRRAALQASNDRVVQRATHVLDAFVVPRGMDAIRQYRDIEVLRGIDPQ